MIADAESLKVKITTAFKNAPFPKDGYDIYAAQTDDDYGSPRFTTEHLPGRKWFEITPEQQDDCYTALTYLRPDGWRHYLPAWIIREIKTPYEGLDHLLFALRQPVGENGQPTKNKHDALNALQVEAVVLYLEYYEQREQNIHATHAHHLYAQTGITWTKEIFPWQGEQEAKALLAYWRGKL